VLFRSLVDEKDVYCPSHREACCGPTDREEHSMPTQVYRSRLGRVDVLDSKPDIRSMQCQDRCRRGSAFQNLLGDFPLHHDPIPPRVIRGVDTLLARATSLGLCRYMM